MKTKIFLFIIFLLISAGHFSYAGKDKYTEMKNVKAYVDFADVIGTMDFKNHSFGIGGVNPMPMPQKTAEGIAKLKPTLIRIFIQEFFFIEKDDGKLDFTALDKYMQSVHSTGADIMASICIKPKSLYPVVDETIWRPNNVKRWQYIIEEMVKRYSVDNKYVTHWGIGNEINIGEWGGCPYKIPDPKDYFEYYKMTVEPVLKVFPQAQVGGPSWAGTGEDGYQFFDEFIGLCQKEKIKLDFVSYNIYSDNPENHIEGAIKIKNIVDKYNSGIKIYITELNMDLGGISVEERAYTPKRAAGLGAILYEYHKRAKFINSFQYHIYDQFCDPDEFKPFYSRYRYMANHWNDEPHRLGLFDMNGNARPQYFMYSMLYAMAKTEVAAKVENYENIRILASHDDKRVTLFLTNYNPDRTEDITLSIYFKNAPQGKARMTVYRIDDNKQWDNDRLTLIPTENRTAYIHDDFWFSLFVPADGVVMVTLVPDGTADQYSAIPVDNIAR